MIQPAVFLLPMHTHESLSYLRCVRDVLARSRSEIRETDASMFTGNLPRHWMMSSWLTNQRQGHEGRNQSEARARVSVLIVCLHWHCDKPSSALEYLLTAWAIKDYRELSWHDMSAEWECSFNKTTYFVHRKYDQVCLKSFWEAAESLKFL